MLDLQPIKARLAAATPGPWIRGLLQDGESYPDGTGYAGEYYASNSITSADENYGIDLAQAEYAADADLIAHAPTDLAALVAEVERRKEDLREAYKRIHDVKALAVENEMLRGENHALQVEVDRLRALIIAHRDGCDCGETQLETPPRQCDVCFALYAAVEDA